MFPDQSSGLLAAHEYHEFATGARVCEQHGLLLDRPVMDLGYDPGRSAHFCTSELRPGDESQFGVAAVNELECLRNVLAANQAIGQTFFETQGPHYLDRGLTVRRQVGVGDCQAPKAA
jgi:hypothetical protein